MFIENKHYTTKESFEADNRIWLAGKPYLAELSDDKTFITLHAENGHMNFTTRLFDNVVDEWELEEVDPV